MTKQNALSDKFDVSGELNLIGGVLRPPYTIVPLEVLTADRSQLVQQEPLGVASLKENEFSPTDPEYVNQWHFATIGGLEDIWSDYLGQGVSVGVCHSSPCRAHRKLGHGAQAARPTSNFRPHLRVSRLAGCRNPQPALLSLGLSEN